MKKVMGPEKEMGLRRSRRGHLPGRTIGGGAVRPGIDNTSEISFKRDGNTVNIDKEMAKLSVNNLMYDALAQIVSKKFQGLKDVIQGGK